jgi:hypothetical protein
MQYARSLEAVSVLSWFEGLETLAQYDINSSAVRYLDSSFVLMSG